MNGGLPTGTKELHEAYPSGKGTPSSGSEEKPVSQDTGKAEEAETVRAIPIIGRLLKWWAGAGSEPRYAVVTAYMDGGGSIHRRCCWRFRLRVVEELQDAGATRITIEAEP
jgi:hypothetical protein